MGDIAATAGVSRQTLYKEFGNKSEFAVNLTIHEGSKFLGAVEDLEAPIAQHQSLAVAQRPAHPGARAPGPERP